VQESTVSAAQLVDRPIARMDAGLCARNSPSTVNLGIGLTENFHRELNATFVPSDLPSN
jgi:hypothetical protein